MLPTFAPGFTDLEYSPAGQIVVPKNPVKKAGSIYQKPLEINDLRWHVRVIIGSLAEWFKAEDLSPSIFGCMGSNPIAVIKFC